jgi:hypothetical protein
MFVTRGVVRPEEATMQTYAIPRFLLIGLLFTLIVTFAVRSSAGASGGVRDWSDTVSQEDVFVQACSDFNITSSYTSDRKHHDVADANGEMVYERLQVSFAGALQNAKNGQFVPIDGKFTRTSDYVHGNVWVSHFELRIGLLTPGDFTVTIARQEMDLLADPVAVLNSFVPRELATDLCLRLEGGMSNATLLKTPFDHQAVDDMTPWTILDPCDTVPPGQGC